MPSSTCDSCWITATTLHLDRDFLVDARRRLCNQAFFTKITLTENLDVRSESTGVYETILDPTNRLHAEFWQRTGQLRPTSTWTTTKKPCPPITGGRVGISTKWWS